MFISVPGPEAVVTVDAFNHPVGQGYLLSERCATFVPAGDGQEIVMP
jgi:hypothetical protein